MPVRLEWFTVHALEPSGKGTVEVLVPEAYLEHAGLPVTKRLDADCIPEVLRDPTVIMEGLERAEFDQAYRYYRKPSGRWNGERVVSPPQGMVFVVYINYSDEREAFVVLDWEWIPEHPSQAGYPACYTESRKTWPAN